MTARAPAERYGIHRVLPGQERTLCGLRLAILLRDLRGECSMCKAADEARA